MSRFPRTLQAHLPAHCCFELLPDLWCQTHCLVSPTYACLYAALVEAESNCPLRYLQDVHFLGFASCSLPALFHRFDASQSAGSAVHPHVIYIYMCFQYIYIYIGIRPEIMVIRLQSGFPADVPLQTTFGGKSTETTLQRQAQIQSGRVRRGSGRFALVWGLDGSTVRLDGVTSLEACQQSQLHRVDHRLFAILGFGHARYLAERPRAGIWAKLLGVCLGTEARQAVGCFPSSINTESCNGSEVCAAIVSPVLVLEQVNRIILKV